MKKDGAYAEAAEVLAICYRRNIKIAVYMGSRIPDMNNEYANTDEIINFILTEEHYRYVFPRENRDNNSPRQRTPSPHNHSEDQQSNPNSDRNACINCKK